MILMEVELNDLKKIGKDLAEILTHRLKTEVAVKGGKLMLDDSIGVKDAKLQVKHALHQLRLSDDYRVLAEHHKIRIVKVERKSHYADKEGTAPSPGQSLPYFFPG